MPRISNRERHRRENTTSIALSELPLIKLGASARTRLQEASDNDDETNMLLELLYVVETSRYTIPRNRRSLRSSQVPHYLYDLPSDKFLSNFRVSRPAFFAIVGLLQANSVFESPVSKMKKAPVEVHLMVAMKYFGCYGNGASRDSLDAFFGIPGGTIYSFIDRVVDALVELKSKSIIWPGQEERREISSRIFGVSKFPSCVGIFDGTLLPLAAKPHICGEDYYSRKSIYAINALIICDDNANIRYMLAGWPGSAHDNRVWKNSKIFLNSGKYFGPQEYLLGDSAFQPSYVMVPAYKVARGLAVEVRKEYFNKALARIRIRSEHCIGILKGRFQWLKCIPCELEKEEDITRVLHRIESCAVLHNLCILDPISPDWIEDEKETDEEPELSEDYDRRDELCSFLLEI